MKVLPKFIVFFIVIFFVAATSATASGRYYNPRYHHYRPHYRHHHAYGHYHSSDHFWAFLGATVLTGVLISTLASQPPRDRIVYYRPQPQKRILLPAQPNYYPPSHVYSPNPELVLRQVEITAGILNIRSIPDLNSEIIGQLVQGSHVGVIGAAPEWLYIKTSSGQYGWVVENYTRPAGIPRG